MKTFLLFLLLSTTILACSVDSECGSSDLSAPGLCQAGVCQCGVGYSGNTAVDPISCSLTCAPLPVPDSVAFLREPNVTVGASAGNLVLDIAMEPYAQQTPTTVALLNPASGLACSLMATELGSSKWTQAIENDASQCFSRYTYASSFGPSVGRGCWETLASTVESGAQYSITFNQYATQVEVIQQGLAPFGQAAAAAKRALRDDVLITRAFRRNYTISVATQFKPNSAPFSVIAEPAVGPTAVNDVASTPENVPKTIAVLGNDIGGSQSVDGVQVPHPLVPGTLVIVAQPAHGTLAIVEGTLVYTPADLYHGADAFEYGVCDSAGLCDNATVAMTVVPDPPVALDDADRCDFQSTVTVAVLANDVAGVGGLVTVTITSNPASGVATVTADKQIQFVAATGFTGVVSIEYEVCDSSNPTVLCDRAILQIDVDGTGPVAVNDAVTVAQNSPATPISVLTNDLAGTSPLDVTSVTIVSQPTHGSVSVNPTTGVVSYTPTTGYHGEDALTYQVCDGATPTPKCDQAIVTVTVTPNEPVANDDSISTPYASPVNIPVLANDVAGAQPLNPASVSITTSPTSGVATVTPDGSIDYTPNAGFVGSETIVYEVCDTSTPTPLCDSATVTIIVQPVLGAGIQYRLVTIDYDVLGKAISATVQTRTSSAAKVASVSIDSGLSTGLSTVISLVEGATCDAGSPAGSCDQFHVVRFSSEPCSVANAEMVLSASFVCANGGSASSCGYQAVASAFTLDKLFLDYDSCPRVVEYGIDSAASFLRLHDDIPRAVPVSAPAFQGDTLYGRCSVLPSAGATFQSVTLTSLHVFETGTKADLGDQMNAAFVTFLSPLVSTSATNAIWNFDLVMDPAMFTLTNTYYLEATLALTFSNTGPLTRKLVINLARPSSSKLLRSSLSNVNEVQLIAISATRDLQDDAQSEGVNSNTFALQAPRAVEDAETSAPPSEGGPSSMGMIAGIVGGVVGAALIGLLIVGLLVVKKRRKATRQRAGSDAPLREWE